MIIIQDDPEQVIPQICERDAQEKTILAELSSTSTSSIYIGMLLEVLSGVYTFRGNEIKDIKKGYNPLLMSFTRGNYKSLCQTIIETYKYNSDFFQVKFYIFENSHEMFEYMKVKGIN